MPLVMYGGEVTISNFGDLFQVTLELLNGFDSGRKKTVVLGPISSVNPNEMEENLDILHYHSELLSEKGWVVLHLPSYQGAIEKLIHSLKITGYPYPILHEFTLPLIRSRCFDVIRFMKGYEKSIGASIEHDVALGCGIPTMYLP